MNPSIEDYRKLQPDYLAKAEEMFGPKTEYNFMGVFYHALGPRTVFFERDQKAITGYFAKIDKSSQKSFALTDQVWMIMKELFDKRNLALSKNGLIWNLPSNS